MKRIQAETQTKMSILGRGSMRDKAKEEELRNGEDPSYEHLKDSLHILVEAAAPFSNAKLGAGVAEIRKMLIPPVSQSIAIFTTCSSCTTKSVDRAKVVSGAFLLELSVVLGMKMPTY